MFKHQQKIKNKLDEKKKEMKMYSEYDRNKHVILYFYKVLF